MGLPIKEKEFHKKIRKKVLKQNYSLIVKECSKL
jgi:hypothetical protein